MKNILVVANWWFLDKLDFKGAHLMVEVTKGIVAPVPQDVSINDARTIDIDSLQISATCLGDMAIYLGINDEKKGPFSEEEIRKLVEEGEAKFTDLAIIEGSEEWVPLQKLLTDLASDQIPEAQQEGKPEESPQNADEKNADEKNTTKLLRQALFSSPWGSVKGFFRDLKAYYRTIFKQIRHPAFSVKEGQGTYFGDIDLVKMSVSLYLTLVLAGMAITELSGKATMGNMAVAGMNLLGLLVFFASIWCAMWIGRIWVKWAKPSLSRRQIDKMFVYEACVVFAMVLPLLLTENYIALIVCWGLAFFHPFYMFFRINKVQATNILVRLCIGGMLTFGFSCSFLTQFGIGKITAADQDEIAAEGTTPTGESGEPESTEDPDDPGFEESPTDPSDPDF